MSENKFKYIGHGIYTTKEASKLTKINTISIKRWLLGYSYTKEDKKRIVKAVFKKDYTKINEEIALSFLDLIEIRFINALRKHKISLQSIRLAAYNAAKILNFTHPFATEKIYTDGKHIFIKIAENRNDLLNLVKSQYEFEEMIKSILHGLDFKNEIANKWWPLGEDHHIVIDPQRSFGKPIIDKYNIPTYTLYSAFNTINSIEKISKWYEIEQEYVQAAVDFEKRLIA